MPNHASFSGRNPYFPAREQSPSAASGPSVGSSTDQSEERILESSITRLLDGDNPEPKPARKQMALFFRAMHKKLCPVGTEGDVPVEHGFVRGNKTEIPGVFKHSGSDTFSVAVSPGCAVERTRSEVETHVALQSYLKHRYGDASIGHSDVITVLNYSRGKLDPAVPAAPALVHKTPSQRARTVRDHKLK